MASVFMLAPPHRGECRLYTGHRGCDTTRALPWLSRVRGGIREAASTRARVPVASVSRVDRRYAVSRCYCAGLASCAWLRCDAGSPHGSATSILEAVP